MCTQYRRGIENLFGLAGLWKQTQISFLGGDCFSCHFSVEVQGNTLHIWPAISVYLFSNTKMIFRQSYSIVKQFIQVYVKEICINGNIVRADCK